MPHARILITEDEAVVAEDLRLALTEFGYEIAGIAGSRGEALALAECKRPDLVLMDIQLAGEDDGIGTATEINERHRIPVVFLTAHADAATLARAREALPYGYVLKPFDENGLHASIETALRLHEAQTSLRRHTEERERIQHRVLETQRLESLGLIAGGVAHDFNNLLTAILGNAQLARSVLPENSEAIPFLGGIEEASQQAARLCAHMLAYAGRQETILAPLDLNEVVLAVVKLLRNALDPSVELILDLATAPPHVNADRAQLQQAAMNLIINAAEALGRNGGAVTIASSEVMLDRKAISHAALGDQSAPGRYAQLEVRDTGCGMSAGTLPKIFDPFFSTKFAGRGLGLAAVHGIARSHRAPIFVRSEPDAGSAFQICLPVCEPEPVPRVAGASPAHWRFRGEGAVLVVEDETTVLLIITRILQRIGFDPVGVVSGQAALDQIRSSRTPPRLVLLDVNLPGMDGVETLRQLRGLLPDTPVLLVSALPEEAVRERFAGERIAGVLHKPFRPDQLEHKIAEVLA